ncbi:MAG: LamG-like jellyroll fold domain-containing protein [Planctomycetota bacterium]
MIGRLHVSSFMVHPILLSLMVNTAIFAAASDGPQDYVVCWTFDETSGQVLNDSGPNGFNGTVSGALWSGGIDGNALDFDGIDDYVEITDGSGYPDPIGDLAVGTVSVWFKFDSIPVDRTIHPLFYLGKSTGGADRSSVIIEIGHFTSDNMKIYFTILTPDGTIPLYFDSGTNLAMDTWYHFAAVVGPDFNTGYLNGVEMVGRHYNFGNGSLSYFYDDVTKEVCWVGSGFLSADVPRHYHDGKIDEIRVYDRPLSGAEVRQYYESIVLPTAINNYLAYWSFDETSGTILHDSSVNGFDGTVDGAAWSGGGTGNALDFDGADDYVDISDGDGYPDLIGSLSEGAVSVWFMFDTIPPDNTIHPIFYLGDGAGGTGHSGLIIEIGHFTSNSKLYFTIFDDNGHIPLCFDSGSQLQTDTWYHFVAVVGAAYNTGYLNGVEMTGRHYNFGNASLSHFFSTVIDQQVCWVGSGFLGTIATTNYYDGKIDEIRIYDQPLSAQDISDYYNLIAPPSGIDDYVAYWSFDETSGTALPDQGPNGFDGQVNGAVWSSGISGNALDFDGLDDYVEITDGDGYPNLIGDLSEGTVSVWFKYDSVPVDDTIHPIFYLGKATGGTERSSVIIEIGHFTTENEKIYFTILTPDGLIPLCFDSGTNLQTGSWYHFAAVVGLDFNTGYLNGVEMTARHYNFGDATLSYFYDDVTKEVCWIGKGFLSSIATENFHDGKIDEIRIYARPLSGGEISQYYASIVPPTYGVEITSPTEGETISGTVTITGTSQGIVNGRIWVQIDGGTWLRADGNGLNPWSRDWDTTTVTDGPHIIRARARECVLPECPAVFDTVNVYVCNHSGGPSDFDCDGDVDLEDFDHFQACASGPAIPQTDPTCHDADLDNEGDVDQSDFGLFQRCYSGSGNPADPSCAD